VDTAKKSSKGQVTISVEIRKKLGPKARRKLWEERYEGDV
jgi:bifunctional DNA-binding transcriptional regulator/antitoxin component of YhaV-PrlF toxin-antitoxin module